ncbi:MAG: glycosyltransferase family 9 protein [Sphingobacteriales bacterium JAD_PAG50586_3]|nr:MAG: glycosyltransferase family 9 protein [Sphingobacteriales bacterium JAD_PAG50586_3]
MKKFLIIQTAFTGDVILATSVAEKLHAYYPDAVIHFVLRKGNEGLLANHPFISKVFVWDKKQGKYSQLLKIAKQLRAENYDRVINLQRFASSGLLTVLSGGKEKVGFDKNPLSFLFTKKVKHELDGGHEVERNIATVSDITDNTLQRPVLYPSKADFDKIATLLTKPYVVFAPASVWFTKQLPKEQWVKLGKLLVSKYTIAFIGGPGDADLCNEIQAEIGSGVVLAGKLSYLESAALIKGAVMNYVNDSAPLHMASAVNAPVTAFFCSTVPKFGFGPLSDISKIVQIREELYCRPCGLHGYKACPQGHFRCAYDIDITEALV